MYKHDLDPHGTVLERWKSAHAQLDHATQGYIDACTALETGLTTPSREPTSRRLQNKYFMDLDLDLPRLPLYEQKLQEARLRLNLARNSSQTLVPINSLPPEVLTMVFTLATQDWVNEDYQRAGLEEAASASDIAGVCRLWRRVMLQSHTFWSELELALANPSSDAYYKRAVLWAERSHSALLGVSVREEKTMPSLDVRPSGDWEISKLVSFLTPLMPRVRSLKICSQGRYANKLAPALLDCWAQYGSVGTAKALEIRVDLDLPELELPGISFNKGASSLYPRNFKQFLSSLQVIRLENLAVHWGHGLYSGLTEIWIEFPLQSNWYPTQIEVASLLAANPSLRSLLLYSIRMCPHRGSTPAPVALDNLEVLCLETMASAKDLSQILPLISVEKSCS
ncbi:hypothetical protein FRC08_001097 [Ceratobasidium sp. 394]|nr:hypothetical protein FRC08_001097 [Ceratobasidium sp. 394]